MRTLSKPLECTFQKVMLFEILELMPLIILHEWVYQGYVKLKFAVLTKRVQHVKRNFLFANQILSSSVPLILLWKLLQFFQWNQRLFCQPIEKHHKCAKSSFVILVGQCKGRSAMKKYFLLDFFLMRGRGPCPFFWYIFKRCIFGQ